MEFINLFFLRQGDYWYARTIFKIIIFIICLVPAIIFALTLK